MLLGLGGKLLHRLPIHSGGSGPSAHPAPRGLQGASGVDLINQAEPLASFHPRFEGRQHALGPHRRFRPRPPGTDLSGLRSPCGHWRRCCFPSICPSRFHLPAALCSTPITALLSSYGRSDSCPRPVLRLSEHELRCLARGQVSLLYVHGLRDHSVPTHLVSPAVALPRYPSAQRAPCHAGSDFATLRQARRFHTAESGSSSYGLVVHLPLLRTPSRDDALTFSYRPESACLTRTLTSLTMHAHRRTQAHLRGLPAPPDRQRCLCMWGEGSRRRATLVPFVAANSFARSAGGEGATIVPLPRTLRSFTEPL